MKKNFTLTKVLYAIAIASTLGFSCSEDDSEAPTAQGIQYDDKVLEVQGAIAKDYGMSDPLDEPGGAKSHRYMELYLSDTSIVYDSEDNDVDGDAEGSYLIVLSLYYPAEDFTSGSFTVTSEDYARSDIEGKAFSDFAEIAIDDDGDGKIGIEPDYTVATEGSTVDVAKDGNMFTLTFDLTLENGKKLTGTHQGEFTAVTY